MAGAGRPAPSWRRRCLSPVASAPRRLLEDGDRVAFLNGLALGHADLGDGPGAWRLHGDLHLHRLEDDHRVAGGDPVSRPRRDLEDDARDVGLDLLTHRRLLPRPSPWCTRPARKAARSNTRARNGPVVRTPAIPQAASAARPLGIASSRVSAEAISMASPGVAGTEDLAPRRSASPARTPATGRARGGRCPPRPPASRAPLSASGPGAGAPRRGRSAPA